MPNKAYHAASGKMVGFDGREADIGWSAIDIGRLLLWLKIVAQRHPQFAEYADKVVLRWSFCDVIDDCGTLYGTARRAARCSVTRKAASGTSNWRPPASRPGASPRSASGSWSNAETVMVDGVACATMRATRAPPARPRRY